MADSVLLPANIQAWRELGSRAESHAAWTLLDPALRAVGLTPFKVKSEYDGSYIPENDAPRGAEPTLYRICDDVPQLPSQKSPTQHFANDQSGRWLLIRLISDGSEGQTHLEILRYLSSYPRRSDARNHCLPLLQEIHFQSLTLGAFRYMSCLSIDRPPFDTFSEVLEFVIQLSEGLAFLHENLIAHRDICEENIVVNVSGSRGVCSWRSKFPIRYWYIDFEYAVRFAVERPRRACRVQGLPAEDWGRDIAREAMQPEPYDPFAVDVFALGHVFWHLFSGIQFEGFPCLIEKMLAAEPSARPQAAEVLESFHRYREELPGAMYSASVPLPTRGWDSQHPNAVLPAQTDDDCDSMTLLATITSLPPSPKSVSRPSTPEEAAGNK